MSQGLKTVLFRSWHWPLLALAFGSKPCSKAAKSERSGRRAGLAGITALVMSGAAPAASAAETMPDTFVDAATLADGLVVDMRYYGASNFVGRPIAGYEAPVCLLTVEAAKALALAQERLRPLGLGLKLFDCYRPASAVADFVQWADDPHDEGRKAEHYPDVPKTELFERGYIAARSGHSRGSTLDVTIIDRASGQELEMGTSYDWFGPESWPSALSVSPEVRSHRLLLQIVMGEAGFRPYEQEWWHFTLADEPYQDRYFDFPVSDQAREGPRLTD